jgi:hypothetical protein
MTRVWLAAFVGARARGRGRGPAALDRPGRGLAGLRAVRTVGVAVVVAVCCATKTARTHALRTTAPMRETARRPLRANVFNAISHRRGA